MTVSDADADATPSQDRSQEQPPVEATSATPTEEPSETAPEEPSETPPETPIDSPAEPAGLPYGAWPSPITADLIVAGSVGLGQPTIDGDDVYWLESRPTEAGRNVLVRRTSDGASRDLTPPPWNVRSRVHEYGGGAYAVRDGLVGFSNDADGRLRPLDARAAAAPRPPPPPPTAGRALRYADLTLDPARDRLICVRENHTGGGEPVNSLVAVSLNPTGDGEPGLVLASGADFIS